MGLAIVPDDIFRTIVAELKGDASVVLMPDSLVLEVMSEIGLDPESDEDWEECVSLMHDHIQMMDDPHGGDPDVLLDYADSTDSYFVLDFISSQED